MVQLSMIQVANAILIMFGMTINATNVFKIIRVQELKNQIKFANAN